MFRAGGRQVEKHVPGRIGKQLGIEESRPRLPLADDLAHESRIGQRRPFLPDERFFGLVLALEIVVRRFEAECPAIAGQTGLPQPLQLFRYLADLFGQAQQCDPVVIRKVAQARARSACHHPAERNDALCARWIDEDMRA